MKCMEILVELKIIPTLTLTNFVKRSTIWVNSRKRLSVKIKPWSNERGSELVVSKYDIIGNQRRA